jgi:hypothetical protein
MTTMTTSVAAEPTRTTWSFDADLRRPIYMAEKLTVEE